MTKSRAAEALEVMALYPPIQYQNKWERLNLCASTLRCAGVLTKKERETIHKRILKVLKKEEKCLT